MRSELRGGGEREVLEPAERKAEQRIRLPVTGPAHESIPARQKKGTG